VDHLERREQTKQLATDVADTNGAHSLARQADAHVVGRLGPPPLARDAIFRQQLVRERKNEREDARRHRTTHAVGGVRQNDAVGRAGLHVYAVVPDTHARDDPDALGGTGHNRFWNLRVQHAQRVVRRAVRRGQLLDVVRKKLPLQLRRVKDLQRALVEDRCPIRAQRVARDPDFEIS
jgi:hypothetical protein